MMKKKEFCESCQGTGMTWIQTAKQKTEVVIDCKYCNGRGYHEPRTTDQQD